MNNAPAACPQCFRNHGFQEVVSSHCRLVGGACPQCGLAGWQKLNESQLSDAVVEFFVSGSYVAETFAPVYQANNLNDRPANFDRTLAEDAVLAHKLTGLVMFHYGPPLWRLGFTTHYDEFSAGGERARLAAAQLVDQAQDLTLPAGSVLYRIRVNPHSDETITEPLSFDPPPDSIVREYGRWDDNGFPSLYVSDDIELCLHECRTSIADEIALATLAPTREIRLLDFTEALPSGDQTEFDNPNIFLQIMQISRGLWLGFSREIGRAAAAAGYDGVRYGSYYSQAKADPKALNLALFGRPLERGDLSITSVNRLRISDMQYKYKFGPVLYQSSEMSAELAGAKQKWQEMLAKGLESPAGDDS